MGPITPDDLRFNRFGLSQQESRVLALAMSGRIDKQIATEMGISLGTVRVYWKRIRMKVGGTRSEVIANLARTSLKLNYEDERSRSDRLAREVEDLQARERGLRAYEAAFEILPTPIAVLDGPNGQIVRANGHFAKLHGYEAADLSNTAAADLMEPGEVAKFERAARKAQRDGKHLESASTRRRKDGTKFASRVSLTGTGDTWVLSVVEAS